MLMTFYAPPGVTSITLSSGLTLYVVGGSVTADANFAPEILRAGFTNTPKTTFPSLRRIACIGHSRMHMIGNLPPSTFNPSPSALDLSFNNQGFQFWLQFLTKKQIRFYDFAFDGATAQDIWTTQLFPALQTDADGVMCEIGINDSGVDTVALIWQIYRAVVAAGKKFILCTDYPKAVGMSSSKARFATFNNAFRDIARQDPQNVILIDFAQAMTDPNSADGNAIPDILNGTDNTHQIMVGARLMGKVAAKALDPFLPRNADVGPWGNGDSRNLVPNNRFGYTTGGTKGGGCAANSTVPDGWTTTRSGSTLVYGVYTMHGRLAGYEAGITPVVGQRIKPVPGNGCSYLVIAASGTTTTQPSSTTLWGTVTDGSITYLVCPEWADLEPGEGYLLCVVTTTGGNDEYITIYRNDITTGFKAGDKLQGLLGVKTYESQWRAWQQRVQCRQSSTKIADNYGPGYAGRNFHFLFPNEEGVGPTPEFNVPAGCDTISYQMLIYATTGSPQQVFLFNRPTLQPVTW
jgi:hypothetical protein